MITPVFALDAEELFEIGQYTDAVALCKQGLELYPEYASGYAVLYKALLALEHISEAQNCLEKGLTFLPANRILIRLLNEHHDKYGLLYIEELPEFPAVFQTEETDTTISEKADTDESSDELYIESDFETVTAESDFINTVSYHTEDNTEENADFEEKMEQQTLTEDALSEVVPTEEVVVDVSPKGVQPETHVRSEKVSSTPMRVIENAEQGEKVLIRASSIGLIPGLQFVPITLRKPARRFSSELPELPAFREFRKPPILPAIKELTSTVKARTPLEELAARLEKARVAIVQEDTPTVHDTKDVEIVTPATETVAKIYETQGAYSQAVRVYEELIRSKPESASRYEELIQKIRNKPDVKKTR